MSNPLNVSFGESPEETGGPLPLWRLQSGGETGFQKTNTQVKMNFPLGKGLALEWGFIPARLADQRRLPRGGDAATEISGK